MMKHLLLVAHGSRMQASNDEVRELVQRLRLHPLTFTNISCAFLELAEPDIVTGLREQIAGGAREIVVMPYFLSAGRHVSTDIPAEVNRIRAEAPEVLISIAPYLGAAGQIVEVIMQQADLGLSGLQNAVR